MVIDPVSIDDRVNLDRLVRPERSPEAAFSLPPAAALIVITVSSLGLWAAIWWAVASLGRLW